MGVDHTQFVDKIPQNMKINYLKRMSQIQQSQRGNSFQNN